MSKEAEDAFDMLQIMAQSQDAVMLYFLAVLPSGKAMHVTAKMMPEDLEEIGAMPVTGRGRPTRAFLEQLDNRMRRTDRLFIKVFKPMCSMLIENMVHIHCTENKKQ